MYKNTNLISEFEAWLSHLAKDFSRGVLLTTANNVNYRSLIKPYLSKKRGLPIQLSAESHSKQAMTALLGTENTLLEIDVSEQFDPNFFCGVSGTVVGGGVLVIVLNDATLKQLNKVDSPNKPDALSFEQNISPTLLRFLFAMLESANCFNLPNADLGEAVQTDLSRCKKRQSDASSKVIEPFNLNLQRTEQDECVEHILKVANGHSRRPLVITADRGRGKSSALGIAAAKLLAENNKSTYITAPNRSNLDQAFEQAITTLTKADFAFHVEETKSGQIKAIRSISDSSIRFIPADQLIHSQLTPNLIIIDEAAGFPVSILEALTSKFNRVVFSTTIHGYEGNGMGFDIRFKQKLLTIRPQSRFIHLNKPLRWRDKDPLEQSLFKAFLLNAELGQLPAHSSSDFKGLTFSLMKSTKLIRDENLLTQVFALLINAHYQTRPSDLERLLSEPKLSIAIATQSGVLVSVCLLAEEGRLTEAQVEDLFNASGRQKGELLPQSMVSHFGFRSMGAQSYLRIMRIATHPQRQRQGVASRLLNYTEMEAEDKYDFLGASYAISLSTLRFWLTNQLLPVRIGSSKDSSSGEFSMEVLKAFNPKAKQNLFAARRRFLAQLNFKAASTLSNTDPLIISYLYKNTDITVPEESKPALSVSRPAFNGPSLDSSSRDSIIFAKLSSQELEEVRQYSEGKRGLPMVIDLLFQLYHNTLNHHFEALNDTDHIRLTSLLIQKHAEQLIITNLGLSGKKQFQIELRNVAQRLVHLASSAED